MHTRKIADSTVRRLAIYLRFLEEFERQGADTLSSEALASRAGTTSAQVRKDLSFFGSFGKRGLGYDVHALAGQLRNILGLTRRYRVILVGAGRLAGALVQYAEFGARGFDIVAVVDQDPAKIGTRWGDLTIADVAGLERIVARERIDIAILVTPAGPAQALVDRLMAVGCHRGAQLRPGAAAGTRWYRRQEREPCRRTGNPVVRHPASRRQLRQLMTGLTAHPAGTLVERALELLRQGPASAGELAVKVLGLPNAPAAVAERIAVALLGADPRVRQQSDGRWALVAAAQGSPLLEECAFAVVDVETTGMQSGGDDRITEIAVVVVHGTRRDVVFESLVNPGRPIPPRICELTGISQEMVAGAPAFVDIADQLLAALAGRVFVAHNARFDWGFVGAEVRRARDLVARRPPALHGSPGPSPGARRAIVFAGRAGDAVRTRIRRTSPCRRRRTRDRHAAATPADPRARQRRTHARGSRDPAPRTAERRRVTPPPSQGRPAVTTLKVGRLTVHALQTGIQKLDGGAMFGVVPKPLWERRIPADERNRIRMGMRVLLIEHDDGLVLVDCGLGNKEPAKFLDIYGIENAGANGRTALEDALAVLGSPSRRHQGHAQHAPALRSRRR